MFSPKIRFRFILRLDIFLSFVWFLLCCVFSGLMAWWWQGSRCRWWIFAFSRLFSFRHSSGRCCWAVSCLFELFGGFLRVRFLLPLNLRLPRSWFFFGRFCFVCYGILVRNGPFIGSCCISRFLPGMYVVGSNFAVRKMRSFFFCAVLPYLSVLYFGCIFWVGSFWFFLSFASAVGIVDCLCRRS